LKLFFDKFYTSPIYHSTETSEVLKPFYSPSSINFSNSYSTETSEVLKLIHLADFSIHHKDSTETSEVLKQLKAKILQAQTEFNRNI